MVLLFLMQYSVPSPVGPAQLYGEKMATVAQIVQELYEAKKQSGREPRLSKSERAALATKVAALDEPQITNGINLSRCQPHDLLLQRDAGVLIEFETLGPYLADYTDTNGRMVASQLTPEDAIGLRLAVTFRHMFPRARMISLCDDYNALAATGGDTKGIGLFTPEAKRNFRESLIGLFREVGAISADASEGREFLLVSETSRVADAARLVGTLEAAGTIWRKGNEIVFTNVHAENPLYAEFHLRTKQGKWLCHTLDASGFLKAENMQITHIVVLPEYMKSQQDKVWEILRVLGMPPRHYHNIFYDPAQPPEDIARAIAQAFGLSMTA